tara:strand:+ start:139 stop:462 length:324 start_codon:yes stop_codon:yes gene_type:complete
MKFARSLTRNMPKYLIVFFGLLLIFNVFAFFLTPGIKEGHGRNGKKGINRRFNSIKNDIKGIKNMINLNKLNTDNNKRDYQRLQSRLSVKKGQNVNADTDVFVVKKK